MSPFKDGLTLENERYGRQRARGGGGGWQKLRAWAEAESQAVARDIMAAGGRGAAGSLGA